MTSPLDAAARKASSPPLSPPPPPPPPLSPFPSSVLWHPRRIPPLSPPLLPSPLSALWFLHWHSDISEKTREGGEKEKPTPHISLSLSPPTSCAPRNSWPLEDHLFTAHFPHFLKTHTHTHIAVWSSTLTHTSAQKCAKQGASEACLHTV